MTERKSYSISSVLNRAALSKKTCGIDISVLMSEIKDRDFDDITIRGILEEKMHLNPKKLDRYYRDAFLRDRGKALVSHASQACVPLRSDSADKDCAGKGTKVVNTGSEPVNVPNITLEDIYIPPIWKMLSMQAHEAFALRDAYIVCTGIKQSPPETYAGKAQTIFKIFHYTDAATKILESNINRYYEKLLPETCKEYVVWQKRLDLKSIPQFPLLQQYRTYMQSSSAKYLEDEYGIRMAKKRYKYHFWQNPSEEAKRAAIHAMETFQNQLPKNLPENERRLAMLIFDPAALAQECIKPIDEYVNRHIRDVSIRLDGSGDEAVISMRTSSLYVWLLPQLTNAGDCRICAICGMPFRIGSQKSKKYCGRHDSVEWDSYRRAIKRMQKSSSVGKSAAQTDV